MKISLSKEYIHTENSSIVWNAYEFLNSKKAQERILSTLPNTPLQIQSSQLPTKTTSAITKVLTHHRKLKTTRTRLKINKTHVIGVLIVLNIIILISKHHKHTEHNSHLKKLHEKRIYTKKKQRKAEQEAKYMNSKFTQLLQKVAISKTPLIQLSISPSKTTIKIAKESTTYWITFLKNHYPHYLPSAEIHSNTDDTNTITLHHEK